MSNKLIILATFDLAFKAEMLRAALSDAGIKSELSDENIVTMDWLLSPAVSGIKVLVNENDAQRAVEVYREWEADKEPFTPLDEAELERQALEAGTADDEMTNADANLRQ